MAQTMQWCWTMLKKKKKKKTEIKENILLFCFFRIIKNVFRSQVKSITPKIFRVHFASEINKPLLWGAEKGDGGAWLPL